VFEQVNRKSPPRNTAVQPSTIIPTRRPKPSNSNSPPHTHNPARRRVRALCSRDAHADHVITVNYIILEDSKFQRYYSTMGYLSNSWASCSYFIYFTHFLYRYKHILIITRVCERWNRILDHTIWDCVQQNENTASSGSSSVAAIMGESYIDSYAKEGPAT